jgi:hypothetical protein
MPEHPGRVRVIFKRRVEKYILLTFRNVVRFECTPQPAILSKKFITIRITMGQISGGFKPSEAVDPDNNVFSGGEHAWNLLSEDSQILARGLYVFSVEDLETGKLYKGKFLIIK